MGEIVIPRETEEWKSKRETERDICIKRMSER